MGRATAVLTGEGANILNQPESYFEFIGVRNISTQIFFFFKSEKAVTTYVKQTSKKERSPI